MQGEVLVQVQRLLSRQLPLPACRFASSHTPPFVAARHLPPERGKSSLKGTAYCGDGKVSGSTQRLPLGGAGAQRLRGYGWRSEKSVKAIAPTGAALAFCASTSSLGLSRASSPWPVAGWVESRGREGGVGTPLPASGLAERPCTLAASKNIPCGVERISNRPACGGIHHKIRAFGYAVLRKIPLLQRHPPGEKIRVACALPRL